MAQPIEKNMDAKERFVAEFNAFETRLNGQRHAAFHATRRAALAKFNELGFPTTRHEDWKYTGIAPLLKHTFALATTAPDVTAESVERLAIPGLTANRVVLINGQFAAHLTHIVSKAAGLVIDSLANALKSQPQWIEPHLSRYAAFDSDPFVALNTAFAVDGVVISVPDGMVLDEPIHLIHLNTGGQPFQAHPRLLVIAGANSRLLLIETQFGTENSVYFSNAVSEIVIGRGATVEHVRLQNDSRQAFIFATRQAHLATDSVYNTTSIDLGGALVRNNLNVRLDGENGAAHLWGFYFGTGEQLIDNHTFLDHAKPNCESNELYKGILGDKAVGVFNGKVLVRPDAQKTNAYQRNQCLLLTDTAVINSKPQLEIFADDVRCTHGAAIGQLNDEALFYLMARGVCEKNANALLRQAYAIDVFAKISNEAVREYVSGLALAAFHQAIEVN